MISRATSANGPERYERHERPQLLANGADHLRVLIADHDGFARATMCTALRRAARVAIVATARDSRETLELVRYYHPTMLILDTKLPPAGSLTVIREVLHQAPQTRIVTVSVNDPQTALAALRAGAIGHIDKDVHPDELARLVLRAAGGEAIIPPRLLQPLLELLRELPDTGWRPLHSRLTTREWEIIELLEHGNSTQQIAEQLVLSPTTIYSHINSILRKLDVHTRPEAITAAKHLRKQEAQTNQPSTPTSTAGRR
jgi:two-component system, NarL family, nitrate/nitrite response regulator NarL